MVKETKVEEASKLKQILELPNNISNRQNYWSVEELAQIVYIQYAESEYKKKVSLAQYKT